jgi:hypothetical protein
VQLGRVQVHFDAGLQLARPPSTSLSLRAASHAGVARPKGAGPARTAAASPRHSSRCGAGVARPIQRPKRGSVTDTATVSAVREAPCRAPKARPPCSEDGRTAREGPGRAESLRLHSAPPNPRYLVSMLGREGPGRAGCKGRDGMWPVGCSEDGRTARREGLRVAELAATWKTSGSARRTVGPHAK